jgi:uncharacterized damage-inducible protein DinB
MGRSYATENDAQRARLKAFVAGLSDATIARSIGHGWTVGVGLAHLAFWDRLWLTKFEEWERTGVVRIPPVENFVNGINDGMLPWWQAIAPAQIKYEVIAAAETVDSKAESLPEALVEAILAARPRTLVRATHRRQHLDEIERVLAD